MPFRRVNPATGQYSYEAALIDDSGRVVLAPSAGSTTVVNLALVASVNAAVAAQPGLRLMGYSCRESAGAPAAAAFNIVQGATAAGTVLVPIKLAASTSDVKWFGPDGIAAASGLSIAWGVGTVDVVLYYKVAV